MTVLIGQSLPWKEIYVERNFHRKKLEVTSVMDGERITFTHVCRNVYHAPYKSSVIHLQNLKNTFRETYLTVNPHRMFSITEEEWNELSIFIQNSIVKWNFADCTQLNKIKWTLQTCSIKFEKNGNSINIILEKKANLGRSRLLFRMEDINEFSDYINDFFDETARF